MGRIVGIDPAGRREALSVEPSRTFEVPFGVVRSTCPFEKQCEQVVRVGERVVGLCGALRVRSRWPATWSTRGRRG